MLVALLAGAFVNRRTPSAVAWFAAGAAPVVLMTLLFKLFLASSSGLLTSDTTFVLSRLAEPGRYWQVAAAFIVYAIAFGQPWAHPVLLLAAVAFALRPRRDLASTLDPGLPAVIAGGMMAVNFAVFLLGSNDLAWHLSTAMQRLYVQLWPSAVFAVFLLLRTPEDHAISLEPEARAKAAKPKRK
jgi:hypothetical protein